MGSCHIFPYFYIRIKYLQLKYKDYGIRILGGEFVVAIDSKTIPSWLIKTKVKIKESLPLIFKGAIEKYTMINFAQ